MPVIFSQRHVPLAPAEKPLISFAAPARWPETSGMLSSRRPWTALQACGMRTFWSTRSPWTSRRS